MTATEARAITDKARNLQVEREKILCQEVLNNIFKGIEKSALNGSCEFSISSLNLDTTYELEMAIKNELLSRGFKLGMMGERIGFSDSIVAW